MQLSIPLSKTEDPYSLITVSFTPASVGWRDYCMIVPIHAYMRTCVRRWCLASGMSLVMLIFLEVNILCHGNFRKYSGFHRSCNLKCLKRHTHALYLNSAHTHIEAVWQCLSLVASSPVSPSISRRYCVVTFFICGTTYVL